MSYFLPVLISFLIVRIMGPFVIPALTKLKASQTERNIMESHVQKTGTPTMGGVMILTSLVVTTLIFCHNDHRMIAVMLLAAGFGVIGFLDDYLKVVKRRSDGLLPWQKMLMQIVLTTAFLIYMIKFSGVPMTLMVPFMNGRTIDIGFLAYPVLYLAVIGTVNGTNFTDGIDGQSSTVTIIVCAFFALAAIKLGTGTETVSLIMAGALLGFLQFNCYPAKVFMGDTGSLMLGGYVSGIAYIMQMPLFIILVGLIYLVEVLSVMIQVSYFKISHGKRIFKMAPIHHHFELSGWSEVKVVTVFATVTLLLSLLSLAGL